MEPYTLNRQFLPQNAIDVFDSIIWTERYYGDSDVERCRARHIPSARETDRTEWRHLAGVHTERLHDHRDKQLRVGIVGHCS